MANESTATTTTSSSAPASTAASPAGVQTQSSNTQAESTQTQSTEQVVAPIVNKDVAVVKPEPKVETPKDQASRLNINEMIAKQLSGELSDADKAALEESGLGVEQLNTLVEAHKQVQLKNNDLIYEAVGGKETYGELMNFAIENLSDDDIDVYNEAIAHPNAKVRELAALGLHSMMMKSKGGNKPQERLSADGDGGHVEGAYASQQDLINDMKNWQYGRDREYTARVDAKRAKSRF